MIVTNEQIEGCVMAKDDYLTLDIQQNKKEKQSTGKNMKKIDTNIDNGS